MHNRYWSEEGAEKEKEKEKESAAVIPTINTAATTTTTSTTGTVLGSDGRERRRYTCTATSRRVFAHLFSSIKVDSKSKLVPIQLKGIGNMYFTILDAKKQYIFSSIDIFVLLFKFYMSTFKFSLNNVACSCSCS